MMHIRRASSEDVYALARLTEQLGYATALSTLSENTKLYLQDGDRTLLVAVVEEDVVGYIALDAAQTFHREGKHVRVVIHK